MGPGMPPPPAPLPGSRNHLTAPHSGPRPPSRAACGAGTDALNGEAERIDEGARRAAVPQRRVIG